MKNFSQCNGSTNANMECIRNNFKPTDSTTATLKAIEGIISLTLTVICCMNLKTFAEYFGVLMPI